MRGLMLCVIWGRRLPLETRIVYRYAVKRIVCGAPIIVSNKGDRRSSSLQLAEPVAGKNFYDFHPRQTAVTQLQDH